MAPVPEKMFENMPGNMSGSTLPLLEGRDIICIAPGYWDSPWITHQQIMSILARQNRVLYVEPPLSYLPFRTPERWPKLYAFTRGLRQEDEGLWITSCPPAPPFKRTIDLINRASQRLVLEWTQRASRRLGLKDPILWIYLPTAVELAGKFGESFVLYHCIDEFLSVGWGRKALIAAQEDRLLAVADLVVTCSEQVMEAKSGRARRIINVPNGVDFDAYNRPLATGAPPPEEISRLKGPVIGFSGVLDGRIDEAFLAEAAARYPEYEFVLLGPARKAFPQLEALDNIHFLGNRPRTELPGFVNSFDLCLIPYQLNDFVKSISPTKLYEYLAAGKPVLAPSIRALDGLHELVYVAGDRSEMVAMIGTAIAETDDGLVRRRVDLASRNTWRDRAAAISSGIMEAERGGGR